MDVRVTSVNEIVPIIVCQLFALTLKQVLPGCLHHQQLCKQEQICSALDTDFLMLCCSWYLKCGTASNLLGINEKSTFKSLIQLRRNKFTKSRPHSAFVPCEKKFNWKDTVPKGRTYWSLISMNMPCKYQVNLVLHKPFFKSSPHTLTLHIMCLIAIVHGRVHENYKPRCLLPVYTLEFILQPPPLRSVFY